MARDSTIGFVILNYNSWKDSIKCIDSILSTFKNEKSIIVVDNCSTDKSYEILKENFRNKKYAECECIKTETNGGFAYGNNWGISALQKKEIQYAVLCNADIVFLTDAIDVMISGLMAMEDTVIYAPIVKSAGGGY